MEEISDKTINWPLWISLAAFIASIIAIWIAWQANEQYARVEKLNVDPELYYFGKLCAAPDCMPTVEIRNTGKISAQQLEVRFNPALVPPSPNNDFLVKYSFSDWEVKFSELEAGQNITLELPKGFLNDIVSEGKKLALTFNDDSNYSAAQITSNRVLLEVQVTYLRDADLKEYEDRIFYIQNLKGDKWISIDQTIDTASFSDMISALKLSENMDISVHTKVGADKVY